MLEQVNAVEYGLTASIWTNDLSTAHRTAAAVQAALSGSTRCRSISSARRSAASSSPVLAARNALRKCWLYPGEEHPRQAQAGQILSSIASAILSRAPDDCAGILLLPRCVRLGKLCQTWKNERHGTFEVPSRGERGDMKRRDFITLVGGAAVAWPLGARAQQPAAGIGFLISGTAKSFAIFVDAFRQGMRDNGMVEDRDYVLDLRFADGDYSRFPAFAAEVAQRKPAVIVVTTISAARAAQRASTTIPIVMTGLIDPVGQGLIASLARPGGNTTGLANLAL